MPECMGSRGFGAGLRSYIVVVMWTYIFQNGDQEDKLRGKARDRTSLRPCCIVSVPWTLG